jgi:hypothetical protein
MSNACNARAFEFVRDANHEIRVLACACYHGNRGFFPTETNLALNLAQVLS